MKSRNGSAAIVIFVIVVVLIVVGVIAWMHYSSQSNATLVNTASSTSALVATTTTATQTPATVGTSTTPSTSSNVIASLKTCSKGSGTITAETVLTDNGSPTAYIDYNVSVNILGRTGQNCSFTIRDPQITSFIETALGKQQITASAAKVQADMQASMSQAPTATCTIPNNTLASVVASFSDPTKFDAFVNSSSCDDGQSNTVTINTSQVPSSTNIINNSSITVADGATATIGGVTISVANITFYKADEATVSILAGDGGGLSSHQLVSGGDPSDDVTQVVLSHHILTITSATANSATFSVAPTQ